MDRKGEEAAFPLHSRGHVREICWVLAGEKQGKQDQTGSRRFPRVGGKKSANCFCWPKKEKQENKRLGGYKEDRKRKKKFLGRAGEAG